MARVVRKQSLWTRLKSYPLDLLLELNEQRELVDWDAYAESMALPLGLILTVVYFFIRFWQDNGVVNEAKSHYFHYNESLLRDSKYFATSQQSLGARIVSFTSSIIITVNVTNTLLFLLKTKRYTIYNKDTIQKSSARKVSRSSWSFLPWVSDEEEVEHWELNMWNPSKFSTHLFVSFPPFNVAFLYLAQSSFTNLAFLLLTSCVLYLVIIKGYVVLIQDKQVLYQETFDEYERKYVRPKLSVAKREVAVDATHGPYDRDVIHYYSPGHTEKLFKTHDKKGRETVEIFSDGEFTPVKKSSLRRSIYAEAYNQSPLRRR